MSVADRLGTGSSFGGVPRGRSARGRAKALVQGDVPAYELSRIRLEEVAPTPLNPRRNFGSDEELTRFGEELRNTQLAACVAISRAAYLKVWPQHEAQIGNAQYVLINGERRYRSASHVGLESLDFVVRDDLAASREAFIDHLLKENLEREDFDVVERARGVQQLVLVCSEESATGARARAAKRLGRDRSWVTNQLSLLELPEGLQLMLSAGTLAERDGRMLARRLKDQPGLDTVELLEYLKEQREREARTREETKALAQQAKQKLAEEVPQQHNAEPAAPEEAHEDTGSLSADNNTAPGTGAAAAPDLSSTPGNSQDSDPEQPQPTPQVPQAAAPAPVRETPPAPRAAEPEPAPAPAPAAAPPAAAPAETPAPSPAPAPSRIPAVSPVATTVPGLVAAEEQPDDEEELLSADNNSGVRTTHDIARGLVHQLGATPKDQARALAAGLNHDELVALIAELRTHM
ncbi:ParB/RepB/Spo0J family partition protein [Streptomyces sp. NPDC004111]|uniref:ParB/RepB/Spo0J family partition protein n=1 Tax=Streptomyces sp. NPDC004111 TaxID=3364690 RepID=UPI00367EFE7E